jgi:hypothetical protein
LLENLTLCHRESFLCCLYILGQFIPAPLFFSKTSYYQFKIYRLSLIADSRKGCLYEVRCPKTTENLKANEVRPYGR